MCIYIYNNNNDNNNNDNNNKYYFDIQAELMRSERLRRGLARRAEPPVSFSLLDGFCELATCSPL